MEATHKFVCQDDLVNPLSSMGMQVACILVISHFFHILLKALGQPGPIAQILAGLVLGPSGLSNISEIKEFFFQASAAEYYEMFGFFCRILFMFLFGLEIDIAYIRHNLRIVCIVAYGGASVGGIFGLVASFFISKHLMAENAKLNASFVFCIMLLVAYTSSPVVNRLGAELRFSTSDIGRLAASAAMVVELTCLLVFNLIIAFSKVTNIRDGFLILLGMVPILFGFKYLAVWLNKRTNKQKYLRNPEVFLILSILIAGSMIIEMRMFNSVIACFVAGMVFPKEGKTARTLLHKLTYSVHNFVLPVYFGYIGFQFDASHLKSWRNVLIVFILVLLSLSSKIGGTLAVCHYLKIPPNEGLFLGFVLSLKGHADILFVGSASKALVTWNPTAYNLLLMTIVINTVISGPVVALLMKREERLFTHTHTSLGFELEKPDQSELRLLACVYGPRHMSAILSVIASMRGSPTASIMPYMAHLIELNRKSRTNVSYHELEADEMSDEEEYGGNDVLEIHAAVDAFTAETRILINLNKAVSTVSNLHEDVCSAAEDLRATVILLPFHKHQRIDGKMESGKEAVRTTNQKILRHAPSSVGIIVEKGLAGALGFSQLFTVDVVQHVATLFFGGPDDREAIAWSTRIANHPRVNLTVIRFLPAESSNTRNMKVENELGNNDIEVFMALSSLETGNDIDNAFLNDFYNGYVASGKVGYVEKQVNNGAETVAALRDIGDLYSLFIVGKGGRGHSPLTTELSDWEECPELGTVGDLLASSDLNINGSILVVQQHRNSKKNLIDD
ncbi:cation/H(+) antiporter 2-like [Pyrus x bretschneideri]|uniref:cation/H(+) antiporter 2-like n=1 Tax=Pyrus x bretschneideri TaxID=225117 RepID=UPI002030CFAD|nr:cation/H(+) antiporter 2-like [Pyrus x bretschneideri]